MNEVLTQPKQRIQSIDILRGAVMLIMALDHVRDFTHIHAMDQDPLNLATTTPVLFFTRWITHFCAPTFVFLSGTSAYLVGLRKSKKELSTFLMKRGLWLVFIEVAVITLGLTYNPFYNFIILQVIWAIGCSMIILGLLVRTNMIVIVVIGCIIFFGHNILDYVNIPKEGAAGVTLTMLLIGSATIYPIGASRFIGDFYAILPWTGAMLLGYAIGSFYRPLFDAVKRKKVLLTIGIAVTSLFIILRLINKYGDPAPWSQQKEAAYTFLSFLNTTKYPCSLQFLCMTLGPALILLALIEHAQNKFTNILAVYGRVPFFYYVIHFYLIHTICVILFFASGYGVKDIVDPNVPFLFRPLHFGFHLWVSYLIWLFVIIVMYRPCKWFQNYKRTHCQWWLSYV
ncbi:MAG TPA: heparan-alpha-glucosaminide N-acetyltransferase domain-containing protein [Chitinophagaceae bacterium]|nr:heparan-alpha-glucosaminide N-acetyltransferase domain-containing protein [Chitinophagaceae bacterium]